MSQNCHETMGHGDRRLHGARCAKAAVIIHHASVCHIASVTMQSALLDSLASDAKSEILIGRQILVSYR